MNINSCSVCENHELGLKAGLICKLTSKKPDYSGFCEEFKLSNEYLIKYRNQAPTEAYKPEDKKKKYTELSYLFNENKNVESVSFTRINKRFGLLFTALVVIFSAAYILLFEDLKVDMNRAAMFLGSIAIIYLIYDFAKNGMIRNYKYLKLDNEGIHDILRNKKIPWYSVLNIKQYSKYINSDNTETYISIEQLFVESPVDIKISESLTSTDKISGYFRYFMKKTLRDLTLHNTK